MGPTLIGTSKNIIRIKELIKHVAGTGLNIVISGETGVGKEVIAQKLYESSPRKGKPFIKINCAALPEGLLESELFGYERGAFTGAERKKRGKFKIAHEGVFKFFATSRPSIPGSIRSSTIKSSFSDPAFLRHFSPEDALIT